MKNSHAILTGLCLVCLGASFVPGLEVLAYPGTAFGSVFALQKAWEAVRERRVDVELLMVLAAVGAIAVGQVRDACALLFLFSLSGTLEEYAMGKTKSAIEGLIKLRPAQALVLRDGKESRVPVEEVVIGDIVKVPPFEALPIDGVVTDGRSWVDQSSMTGESRPVEVSPGSKVIGGTQNADGLLTISATSVVGDSALDRIVDLVQEAQDNKASGERISTWFGQRYTFFVLGAFAVGLIVRLTLGHQLPKDALYGALTLLVGLSPCALVISIPATTLSALAWSARNGMLVRGGKVIEDVGKIRFVAMDKTGTLTYGRSVLQEICVCVGQEVTTVHSDCGTESGCWARGGEMSPESARLLRLAASAEQYASHPVAEAVIQAARDNNIDVPEAIEHKTLPGLGVSAMVDGHRILLGQEKLLREEGIPMPADFLEHAHALGQQGMTVALLATKDGLAALGFSDTIRDDAKSTLVSLRNLGVESITMLTGDTPHTAEVVAKEVGTNDFKSGLMPEEKTAFIAELSAKGPTMMVGDGVNDAPALTRADVGVAMGGLGSDVALNAAEVVLINDRLDRLPQLIQLGRLTNRIIRTNLFFASGMIIVLAISSFLIKLPLPIAVIGHEGSTVLVILNGLRLLRGPSTS